MTEKVRKELTDEELKEIFMNNFDSYEKAGDGSKDLIPMMSRERFCEVLEMLRKSGRLG